MNLDLNWEYVADTVMGGVSTGGLSVERYNGRDAVVLRGDVSTENNGGFVQMASDLAGGAIYDASAWDGIEIEVAGNSEGHDLRLRTPKLSRPWQSFRADFVVTGEWQTLSIPFAAFEPNNTTATLDRAQLQRIGILGVGRAFEAEVALAGLRFYRDA